MADEESFLAVLRKENPTRKEVQRNAKLAGIPANIKTEVILDELRKKCLVNGTPEPAAAELPAAVVSPISPAEEIVELFAVEKNDVVEECTAPLELEMLQGQEALEDKPFKSKEQNTVPNLFLNSPAILSL